MLSDAVTVAVTVAVAVGELLLLLLLLFFVLSLRLLVVGCWLLPVVCCCRRKSDRSFWCRWCHDVTCSCECFIAVSIIYLSMVYDHSCD